MHLLANDLPEPTFFDDRLLPADEGNDDEDHQHDR